MIKKEDFSLTNKKLQKAPSILIFKYKRIKHSIIKKVWEAVSSTTKGKLNVSEFTNRTLKIIWNKIDNDKKISGINDLVSIISIKHFYKSVYL